MKDEEPQMTMKPICKNCHFWLGNVEDANTGYCRRQAPSPTLFGVSEPTQVHWPATSYKWWCGEHKPSDRMEPIQ